MNVDISPIAQEDLKEIREYIADDSGDNTLAKRVVKDILLQTKQLNAFAQSGTPLSSILDIDTDYRYLLCYHYYIFYRVDEKQVSVDRIIHSSRNIVKILFEGK